MAADRASFGFSLFCDDIRHELGGKYSLIGLYDGELIFPKPTTFPTIIPKFVIFVKYFEIIGTCEEDLSLQITLPGDELDKPSVVNNISRKDISSVPVPPSSVEDSQGLYTLNLPFVLSPFTIKCEGLLRVRMYSGADKIRLGSLRIRRARDEDKIEAPGF